MNGRPPIRAGMAPPARAEPNRPAIVEAIDVAKTYHAGPVPVPALRNLSLRVHPGEMVAVMGPSGCGKTTLLNCLSGLDDVDGGRVLVEGQDLARLDDDARTTYRARRMGFIFQSFNLLPVLNAVENVELPLLVAGVRPRDARTRAEASLKEVGLAHRVGHRPKELSGGEQQRVAIARSIVNRPAIVWADEPTGNLDSDTSRGIIDLLKRLNESSGQTYVVVTHAAEVARLCDRVVRMRNGAIESITASKPGDRTE
jgi:putative ABC transport system ATP-binding protein